MVCIREDPWPEKLHEYVYSIFRLQEYQDFLLKIDLILVVHGQNNIIQVFREMC